MSSRPRLVHVTTTDISLALLLGPQLRAFRDAGYDVIGVSAPGSFTEELESWGITHVPMANATRSMAPYRDLKALQELTQIFRDLKPQIVHTHNPKPGIYGRLAARRAHVPVVVNTVHGLYALPGDPALKRAVVYNLERVAARCSDAELLQNVEDLPVLRELGIPESKLHVLGNGIDLTRFDPDRIEVSKRKELRAAWGIPDDAIVCGVVGRLVWEKGLREMFFAARALRTRFPNLHFVVVGPGDDDKADGVTSADRVAAARDGNVTFAGMRDDIDEVYSAFDLFALASYREGFPRSAMEAAAMGLPVVATNIRGCRQVVDDGGNGFLVTVRDGPALASAIEKLACDADLRAQMGDAGRAKARTDFDQQRCIDLTLETYQRLGAGPDAANDSPEVRA
jgi:glycosyltransferase involved in cell wall biosynthesis